MKILGIDPGLASTGWAILYQDKTPALLARGCFTTDKKIPLSSRLLAISREINRLTKLYRPSVLAVEEIFFARNTKTAITIAQCLGVIKMTAAQLRLAVAGFTPLNIKMAMTGYGRADKKQVEFMLHKCLNLTTKIKPHHAADAAAVALTYLFTNQHLTIHS
jgi:crossover junction endodeoxyribonuclease RuvC